MKLKNKKTGEILDFNRIRDTEFGHKILLQATKYHDKPIYIYNSLAELNEVWEDCEEPNEYWYIDYDGGILCSEYDNSSTERMMISMGNHFESLEEAEKAVEKLKAIEKLKEYELYIEWANTPEYDEDEDRWYCSVDFSVREGCDGDKLFDLLFGGEE